MGGVAAMGTGNQSMRGMRMVVSVSGGGGGVGGPGRGGRKYYGVMWFQRVTVADTPA